MRATAISGERKKQSPMKPWRMSVTSTPLASSPAPRTNGDAVVALVAQRVVVLRDACRRVWLTADGTSMSVMSSRASQRPTAALPAVRWSCSTRSTVGDEAGAGMRRRRLGGRPRALLGVGVLGDSRLYAAAAAD